MEEFGKFLIGWIVSLFFLALSCVASILFLYYLEIEAAEINKFLPEWKAVSIHLSAFAAICSIAFSVDSRDKIVIVLPVIILWLIGGILLLGGFVFIATFAKLFVLCILGLIVVAVRNYL